jgi:hypothetical protein
MTTTKVIVMVKPMPVTVRVKALTVSLKERDSV